MGNRFFVSVPGLTKKRSYKSEDWFRYQFSIMLKCCEKIFFHIWWMKHTSFF